MLSIIPDDELTARIKNCNSAHEIEELLHQQGVRNGVLVKNADGTFAPAIPNPTMQPVRKYQKVLEIGGYQVELTASSQERLDAMEADARSKFQPR
jgi:hypothetical protein